MKIELEYKDGKPLVWFTWVQHRNGFVELRSVSLTRQHARYAKAICDDEVRDREVKDRSPFVPLVRCWQEECLGEHCYGTSMLGEPMALAKMTRPRQDK